MPMAERIDSMNNSDCSLEQQLDELHRIVHDLDITAGDHNTPPPVPPKDPARLQGSQEPPQGAQRTVSSDPEGSQSLHHPKYSLPRIPHEPRLSVADGASVSSTSLSPTGNTSRLRTFLPSRNSVSEPSYRDPSLRYSSSSYSSSDAGQSTVVGQSPQSLAGHSHLSRQHSTSTKKSSPSFASLEPRRRADHVYASLLSPPGTVSEHQHVSEITHSPQAQHSRSSPYASSLLSLPSMVLEKQQEPETTASPHAGPSRSSLYTASHVGVDDPDRMLTSTSQTTAFRKEAFRNSAILCDV